MQKIDSATLNLKLENGEEKKIDLLIKRASIGQDTVDILKLYQNTNLFTYDPGFGSTASCESKITYVDGDAGVLRYRGYPIEELAEKSTFEEVCYLLLYGELPSINQLSDFEAEIKKHTMVHEQLQLLCRGFPRKAHPMAIMIGATSSLSAFYDDFDMHDKDSVNLAIIRLLAKMPTIAAMVYKYSIGQPIAYPKNKYNFSENLLNMLFAVPSEEMQIKPAVAKALEILLILQADHEQNASTSAVKLITSTGASPFAAISAGIAALWGPLHGGANEAVIKMLQEIGSIDRIPEYIKKAKDKNDSFKLMGFGHRVYKNYDPRAKVIKKACDDVLRELETMDDNLLHIAIELERIALQDEYFISRKLFPNVDFYSGIIYKAIGLPTSLFTPMFAVARTVGWLAQWRESLEEPDFRICRPRQLYTGYIERQYTAIDKRP